MSAVELNQRKIIISDSINTAEYKKNVNSHINNNEIVRAAQIISKYGPNALSQIYINEAIKQAKNTHDIYGVDLAIAKSNNVHHTTWAAKNAVQRHVLI